MYPALLKMHFRMRLSPQHILKAGKSQPQVRYSLDIRFSFTPQSALSTQLHFITAVVCWGQHRTPYQQKSQWHVAPIDICARKALKSTSWLLSVLGTVYKLHPTDWWQKRFHGIVSGKKSPQITWNIFSHSDCCSTCQWWAFTYYGSLFVDILHNSETGWN